MPSQPKQVKGLIFIRIYEALSKLNLKGEKYNGKVK